MDFGKMQRLHLLPRKMGSAAGIKSLNHLLSSHRHPQTNTIRSCLSGQGGGRKERRNRGYHEISLGCVFIASKACMQSVASWSSSINQLQANCQLPPAPASPCKQEQQWLGRLVDQKLAKSRALRST